MSTDEIVDTYNKTESLKETAKICNINWQKVRRILITEGKYENEISNDINELYSQGWKIEELSKKFCISKKAINNYLPYVKGIYNRDDMSINAKRIKKSRQSKNKNGGN